jgi:hypothetical protein
VQNQKDAARLSIYYGLHINAFLSAQLNGDCGRTDIILDEAANTPVRDLIEKVTIFRAYGLRVIYIAQSRSDMQRQHGEKLIATLEDNCNLQILRFANFEEAERVSRAIGEVENVNFTLSQSGDRLDLSHTMQTGRERMFAADELMSLPLGTRSFTSPALAGRCARPFARTRSRQPATFSPTIRSKAARCLPIRVSPCRPDMEADHDWCVVPTLAVSVVAGPAAGALWRLATLRSAACHLGLHLP